jgi:RNA polymerase sigma-70 factor (sigma-E family)
VADVPGSDGYDEFRAFVLANSATLMRTAYLLTQHVHLAEDLLQTVLTRTAMRWKQVNAEKAAAYVRSALYRESVSWWRRRKLDEALTPETPDPSTEDFSEGSASRMTVQRALRRLTPKQRAVLVLRFFEDLTEVETAELLGCSVGTVKSQTRYALERLRVVAPELVESAEVSG